MLNIDLTKIIFYNSCKYLCVWERVFSTWFLSILEVHTSTTGHLRNINAKILLINIGKQSVRELKMVYSQEAGFEGEGSSSSYFSSDWKFYANKCQVKTKIN